ncbi:MAG TPA: hypothetical protein VIO11_02360, partial [Candidatus Methanoperedens sp.]
MKITVHYDFTQQELVGETDIIEIAEGTRLVGLLQLIDGRITDAGKNKGIETAYKTTLADRQLNGC